MKLLGRLYNSTKQSTSYRRNTRILILLLLVPVILILLLNFIILYQKNLVSMEEKLDIESDQKLQLLNTSLAPMFKLVDLRRTDHTFSTDYLEGPHFSDTYFEIKKALKQDSVWISFFDSISYYNREYNKVFSYDCAKNPDEFFGWGKTKYAYPLPSLKVEESARYLLEQEGNQIRTIRAHNIHGEDGVVFALPIEIRNNASPASYMIFTVSDKTLENMWGSKDGISYTLYYNQLPIYTSKASMSPTIKEKSKSTGLLSEVLLRNYQLQIGGLTIIWQIHPSYFLKSIFPSLLLEAITTFAVLAVSLIILLHYSRENYEPVRRILQHLPQQEEKPTLVDELRYIDFMLEDLTSTKIYLEQTNREMRLEKHLYYIFGNLVEPGSELAKQCLEAGIRIDRRWYACILLTDTTQNNLIHHKFLDIFSQTDNTSNLYSMNVNDAKKLYLLASDLKKEVLEVSIQKLRGEDEPELYISCLVEGVQNVHLAYGSICGAVSESEGRAQSQNEYPVLELQFLQAAIDEANMNKAEFSVRMLKKYLENSNDILCGAILVAAGAIFSGENINQVNALICGMTEFDAAEVCERLDLWLKEYSQRMNATAKSNTRVLVRNMHTILKYIEEHAARPDFTIKSMAIEFGTSVSNLGHQFKSATGQTLSYFIDDWKIKKAEEMLVSGESISEISHKLGYLSTPAFTEAFKRLRGMTPSAYRSNYIGRNSVD